VKAELAPGDHDAFRFAIEATGGSLLDAWIDGPAGIRFRALDGEGKELATAVTPARIGALGVVQGAYTLLVDQESPHETIAYRLRIKSSPWVRGVEWEPNEDGDHASDLLASQTSAEVIASYEAYGWWSHPGDVDCFLIPLTVPAAGAVIQLELQPPKGVVGHLSVLDTGNPNAHIERKQLVEATSAGPGQSAIIPTVGARSWEPSYLACTSAQPPAENPAERYSLKVTLETPKGPFEFEPNDTKETATALPRDITISGYLTAKDVDWYGISSGPKETLRVSLNPPTGVAGDLTLFDAKGKEILHRTEATSKMVTVESDAAALVRVRSAGGESFKDTYHLTTTRLSGGAKGAGK
jgi:hypothetical protein